MPVQRLLPRVIAVFRLDRRVLVTWEFPIGPSSRTGLRLEIDLDARVIPSKPPNRDE